MMMMVRLYYSESSDWLVAFLQANLVTVDFDSLHVTGAKTGVTEGEKDVMTGDMTHLLPSGCPDWPSCPTEGCWCLPHLTLSLLASLSLWSKKAVQRETKKEEVSEDFSQPLHYYT